MGVARGCGVCMVAVSSSIGEVINGRCVLFSVGLDGEGSLDNLKVYGL